eukprot:6058374-Ditylum_brightwellii.AAC.1
MPASCAMYVSVLPLLQELLMGRKLRKYTHLELKIPELIRSIMASIDVMSMLKPTSKIKKLDLYRGPR